MARIKTASIKSVEPKSTMAVNEGKISKATKGMLLIYCSITQELYIATLRILFWKISYISFVDLSIFLDLASFSYKQIPDLGKSALRNFIISMKCYTCFGDKPWRTKDRQISVIFIILKGDFDGFKTPFVNVDHGFIDRIRCINILQ